MKPASNCTSKTFTSAANANPNACYNGLVAALMLRIVDELPYNVVVNRVETEYGSSVDGRSNKWSGVVGILIDKVGIDCNSILF